MRTKLQDIAHNRRYQLSAWIGRVELRAVLTSLAECKSALDSAGDYDRMVIRRECSLDWIAGVNNENTDGESIVWIAPNYAKALRKAKRATDSAPLADRLAVR